MTGAAGSRVRRPGDEDAAPHVATDESSGMPTTRVFTGRTATLLGAHAAGLGVAALLHWTTGRLFYRAVAASFIAVVLVPIFSRWYARRARQWQKLLVHLAAIGGMLTLVGFYVNTFGELTVPPPNPLYWLLLAFIVGLPLALIRLSALEIRDLIRAAPDEPPSRRTAG